MLISTKSVPMKAFAATVKAASFIDSAAAFAGNCVDTKRTRNGSVTANVKVVNDMDHAVLASVEWTNPVSANEEYKSLKSETTLSSGQKIDVTQKNVNFATHRVTIEDKAYDTKFICKHSVGTVGSLKLDNAASVRWEGYSCGTANVPYDIEVDCSKSYNSDKDRWTRRSG